jgi:hypothetical protein
LLTRKLSTNAYSTSQSHHQPIESSREEEGKEDREKEKSRVLCPFSVSQYKQYKGKDEREKGGDEKEEEKQRDVLMSKRRRREVLRSLLLTLWKRQSCWR